MVFYADDRVLIEVLRHEKGYSAKNSSQNFPASQIWEKLQEHVYRSQIHDVDQLKSRLIEEWEHFHQVFIDEAIRLWCPHLPACIRAHGGHFEHILLVMFDICTDVHLTVICLCGCL